MSTRSPQIRGLTSPARLPGLAGSLEVFLLPFLGAALLVRVLTDDVSAPDSRYSGGLNLSAVIALMFVALAGAMLARRRRGVKPAVLILFWLCVWMAVALNTRGASTATLREGVREVSVIALFLIVYNARGLVTVPRAARLLQFAGAVPAILALYQLASNTGMDLYGEIRSNGTFAHPNSAAMFFAIVTVASLWLYLDQGRRRLDALLTTLFAAALIATFSIDGLATLTAMLITFGVLRKGPLGAKLAPCAIAVAIVIVFFATPLGSHRIAREGVTSIAAAERGETTSTLDTRLYRWKTLLPEWERSPLIGRGLGVTTNAHDTATNRLNSLLPHNEYIRYLVETGIVGLAILLAGLYLLVRALVRRLQSPFIAREHPNAVALAIAVVVGCLVNSLADNTLLNSPTCYAAALIVASVLSLASAAPSSEKRPRAAAQPA
jgi:O-antigen ligase